MMRFVIVNKKRIHECDGCCTDAVPAAQPTIFDGPDRWDNILGVGFQTPNKTFKVKRKKKKNGK